MKRKIAIIGDGGWGTTLALLLHGKGEHVVLWGAFADYVDLLKTRRENAKFLPGVPLPAELNITHDLGEALEGAATAVMAVPSQYMRDVAKKVALHHEAGRVFVSVAKGIEIDTMKSMSQILKEEIEPEALAVLSGPSHAEEVARGIPTSVSVASYHEDVARSVQKLFMTERFRIYTNSDLTGVELGGALKNVIAVAAGISDGLGYGDNTKSALLSRGLAEMTRLGVAMGARKETFFGLAGMGDLITTSFSRYGRNRRMGELLGKGMTLEEALATTEQVAEGVKTCVAVEELSEKYRIEMPISHKVYEVLYHHLAPEKAVRDLMMREPKPEH